MTAAIVPFGHDLRSIRGPVLRFIGWLLGATASTVSPCTTCQRIGHHAEWCNWTVRVRHGMATRERPTV